MGPRVGGRELYGAEFLDHGFKHPPYETLWWLKQRGLIDWVKYSRQDGDGRGMQNRIYYFLSWYGEAALRKWEKYQSLLNEARDWFHSYMKELEELKKPDVQKFDPIDSGSYHAMMGSTFSVFEPELLEDEKAPSPKKPTAKPPVKKKKKTAKKTSKKKKKKTQRLTAPGLFKHQNGYWYVDFFTPDGKRIRRTTRKTIKSEAQQVLKEFKTLHGIES